MIDLRGEELIEHLHGRGKQDADIGLADSPAKDVRQKGFPDARIADNHDVGSLFQELQVEQAKDAILRLLTGFVMGEMELVEGRLGGEMRELEAALDGTLVAGFQFQIRQALERGREAKILARRLSRDRLQALSHGGQ